MSAYDGLGLPRTHRTGRLLIPEVSKPFDVEGARRKFLALLNPDRKACVICAATDGVALEPSRTAYVPKGPGDDCNAPVLLCRPCAKEHHAYLGRDVA